MKTYDEWLELLPPASELLTQREQDEILEQVPGIAGDYVEEASAVTEMRKVYYRAVERAWRAYQDSCEECDE